jgi:nicotinamide phosphoribosyltransferase
MNNNLLKVDLYKVAHHIQYPQNTQVIYSYAESRGGELNKSVFFGLQYFLNKIRGKFVERWMIEEADYIFKKAFGFNYFNRAGW